MHELGLATGVLDSVVKVAKENNCLCVKKIDVVVGKKAAIVDELFTEAFDALKQLDEYQLCQSAKIKTIPAAGRDVYVDKIEVDQDE